MKILLTLSQLNGHGGIPRFNQNLLEVLSEDHSLQVLSLNDKSTPDIQGFERNKIKLFLAFVKAFSKRPDVIIIGHINLLPLLVFKWLTKAKVITIIHGIDAWTPKESLAKFYSLTDRYWSVSNYTKTVFAEQSKVEADKIDRIFNTLPKQWNLTKFNHPDQQYMLTVTRVDRSEGYKGIDKTLLALSQVKDMMKAKDWKLKAVLSGDDVDRHKALVEEYGLKEFVDFYSAIDDQALQRLYQECSFFILPSTGEGFGIVFLEAMSYQKAVIGSRNCGTEDVIDHSRTGFLINAEVDEIQQSLMTLMDDKALRKAMGEQGFEKLNQEFTYERFKGRINYLLVSCAE